MRSIQFKIICIVKKTVSKMYILEDFSFFAGLFSILRCCPESYFFCVLLTGRPVHMFLKPVY